MKKILFVLFIGGIICTSCFYANKEKDQINYAQYVNPFIGTADNGHTFPGATAPFGLVQASPETGNDGWKYCSGYNYADDSIIGFAQTHLNGTGGPDLGDILLFPFCGEIDSGIYKSKFEKATQKGSAGYYAVNLSDFDVDVEVTATARTAFYKYTYNNNEPARLMVDLQNGIAGWGKTVKNHVISAQMNMPDNKTITGHNEVDAWVKRHYFYAIKFDKPFTLEKKLQASPEEKAQKLVLSFDLQPGESLQVKVALSGVSVNGAMASIDKENAAWDFNKVRKKTETEWNKLLSRTQIVGTDDEKVNFYTSLYHLYIQPNNLADTDGRYRGLNDSLFTSPTKEYYSTLSLWDTYRAAHPWYTIMVPEKVNGMVQTMLNHYKIQGFLPIWALWGKETFCMIGNHAIPVVVDAYLKGFDGFDSELAYEAVRASATTSHLNSDWETYTKYGYYPFDLVKVESVSRTLESAFDDYCVAQMAKAMGKTNDFEYFSKRADYYKNLFDPSTKLMRGKDSEGNWREPFNSLLLSHATTAGGDYTEGNAWQYTWHVQHDIESLVDLMGSEEIFANKLDSLFFIESNEENVGFVSDVTGLIGQYAHGNEPSHHVAYLYNYAGQSWKTQQLVREIFDRFYLAKPDGLCGNDDCGQMSAWYVFSSMGFYPLNPAGGEYILGAPQLKKAILSLPGDKTFTIEAKNLNKNNKYVKCVTMNGKPLEGFIFKHDDILRGGTLTFEMTNTPAYE
ncbi:alpha-1,2-mannosidase, putative [Mariniphaga anaerophila]|uniref:Alpha-1,2-mannosidase, putative n=1 Tax=Mariniphaga anaerophila TaxID=1484053 RepID=A0A1M4WK53_9BACT|nr:GH92 family glycosyl hydrolase [Mariniphaga anaerophila]SHE81586.1 alpha-1,2-mannosidase, putative [Mariniphaga anaerophila]